MAGAVRCLLVRVERFERQLADASECSKGGLAPQTLLERISRCALTVVGTLVPLDRSLQERVVEWLGLVRVEPQEIALPIKEETVDAVTKVLREGVRQRTAEQIEDGPQSRDEPEETLDPRERVQQRTADQVEDSSVPRERVQQRAAGEDRRLQRIPFGNVLRGSVKSTASTRWPRYSKTVLQEQAIT